MTQETLSPYRLTSVDAQKTKATDYREHIKINKSPENFPRFQAWLGLARAYLTRPEAAEWKQGPIYYKDTSWFRNKGVSLSEKYLALENKDAKRSFVISTYANSDYDKNGNYDESGKSMYNYRQTNIRIANLPDTEEGWVRTQSITIIHNEQGKIISIVGGDSIKNRIHDGWGWDGREMGAGFKKENWYGGVWAKSVGQDEGLLTPEETKALMDEITPQLQMASIDEK